MISSIKTLAIQLMAGVAFAACSSSDDSIIEQPVNPTEPKTYTMTVQATKGDDDSALARAMAEAGLTGNAQTRALSLSSDGKTLDATWAEGETVTVIKLNKLVYVTLGTLTAQSSGATTTLTGQLTGTINEGDELYLLFHAGADLALPDLTAAQDGTLQYIADNLDYDEAWVTVKSIDGDGNITINEGTAEFIQKAQAIVRFTLVDKADPTKRLKPSKLTISETVESGGGSTQKNYTLDGLTDATYTANAYAGDNGDGVLYAALKGMNGTNFTLTATMPDGDTYEYVRPAVEFEVGSFYSITVKMSRTYDLSQASGDITLKDGDVLTGRLAGSYNISIADGATVTLNEAYISPEEYVEWDGLGITCLGDATIVLSGDNVVWSTVYKPAIQAGPDGTTLTITGTGTLTAGSDGDGAAIGSGSEGTCGDIIITGGTVTAMCSNNGAAIGSSQGGSCGDIIITGGTVTATSYGTGAGIGSGNCGNCGKIIISGGSVTATGGLYAAGIGNAQGGSCEAIYITNGVTRVEADNSDEYSDSRYPSIGLPGSEVRIGCWYDTESGVSQGGTVYWINEYLNDGEKYLNQHPLIYPEP